MWGNLMKKKTYLKNKQKIQTEKNKQKIGIKNDEAVNKKTQTKKNKTKKFVVTGCVVFLSAFLFVLMMSGFGYILYLKTLQNDKLFKNGLIAVQLNGKWGYINSSGKTVLDFKYDSAFNFSDCNLALVGENGKFGYINKKGEYVIPLEYDEALEFVDGLAVCCKDGKYGAINFNGDTCIEFKYSKINQFCGNYAIASVKVNNQENSPEKMGIIDRGGKVVVEFEYDNICGVNDNFFMYRKGTELFVNTLKISTDNFYKKAFQEVTLTDNGYCVYRRNGLYGLIGKEGIIFDEKYAGLNYKNDNYLICSTTGDYYGYIDFEGEIIISEKYLFASSLNEYAVIKYSGDELFYLINDSGKEKFSIKCDMLGDFNNGRAYYKENGKYGVITLKGKKLCEAKYNYVSKFYDDGFAIVSDENGHFGIVDSSCKEKVKLIYDAICFS